MKGLLALFCAVVASGQSFFNPATNRDGSTLYFTTSARLKETAEYFTRKVFRWDGNQGVTLLEQRPADYWAPDDPIPHGSNYAYSLFAPFVSSGGAVVAFSGARDCSGLSSCLSARSIYQTTVRGGGRPEVNVDGAGSLSPNGRYLLLSGPAPDYFAILDPVDVLDLEAGSSVRYASGPPSLTAARHRVANDGSILVANGGLFVARGSESRPVPGTTGFKVAMMNDSATRVVFRSESALRLYSTLTGATTDLVTGIAANQELPFSISDDGALVAMVLGAGRQVYVAGADGNGLRQLGPVESGAAEITLSGDGAALFATTFDGRIVRIDVASGRVTEIVSSAPAVTAISVEVRRGAIETISGARLAAQPAEASDPYPKTLGGVEVWAAGSPVPLVSVAPDGIRYVVPWDLPATYDVEVHPAVSAASPFCAGFAQQLKRPSFLAAAHDDFHGAVAQDDPARPGEIIHLYARDLGRVDPQPPPGKPAPLAPLSRLVPPISCLAGSAAAEVLYSGLAPGLDTGVFQIDVRLPAVASDGAESLSCAVEGVGSFRAAVYIAHSVRPSRSSLVRR